MQAGDPKQPRFSEKVTEMSEHFIDFLADELRWNGKPFLPLSNDPGTPGQPGPVSWNDVQNKPQKFPPQEHSHSVTDIGDFVQKVEEIVTNGETPDLSIYATKIYVDHKVAEIVAANQVVLTQLQYNYLSVKDPNTLYLIPEVVQ